MKKNVKKSVSGKKLVKKKIKKMYPEKIVKNIVKKVYLEKMWISPVPLMWVARVTCATLYVLGNWNATWCVFQIKKETFGPFEAGLQIADAFETNKLGTFVVPIKNSTSFPRESLA